MPQRSWDRLAKCSRNISQNAPTTTLHYYVHMESIKQLPVTESSDSPRPIYYAGTHYGQNWAFYGCLSVENHPSLSRVGQLCKFKGRKLCNVNIKQYHPFQTKCFLVNELRRLTPRTWEATIKLLMWVILGVPSDIWQCQKITFCYINVSYIHSHHRVRQLYYESLNIAPVIYNAIRKSIL